MKSLKLDNGNELRLPILKKILQVMGTTTLALTVGIVTEVEVKGETYPPITNDIINLIVNEDQTNQQYSLSDTGDIDLFSISFPNSGNYDIVVQEIIFPSPDSDENLVSDNFLTMYLFDENQIFLMESKEFFNLNFNLDVNENSNYLLAVNSDTAPILNNNNQLIDWNSQPPFAAVLVPYNLNISSNQSSIPEPSTVLGLILFGFLGVIKGGKKN